MAKPTRLADCVGPRWESARFPDIQKVETLICVIFDPRTTIFLDFDKELIDFCKETLAGFKVPKQVIFCELPKTSTGKIQKFELRKKF